MTTSCRNLPLSNGTVLWARVTDDTRRFAVAVGLKPSTTPVCIHINGMAESFVKTMKCDYVAFIPKPNAATAVRNLAIAFEHYNENMPIAR